MKRTLYALLICATAVAVILAISMLLEKKRTPVVAVHFLGSAIGGTMEDVLTDVNPTFRAALSHGRQSEIFRRYSFILGPFQRIEEVTARREPAPGVVELDLRIACEKSPAKVWLRLRQMGSRYLVEDVAIDAPQEVEMVPTQKSLQGISLDNAESIGRQEAHDVWDYLSREIRAGETREAWVALWRARVEELGPFVKAEPIGEPEKVGAQTWTYAHRLRFEDSTIVIRERWRFHDISWVCEAFDATKEKA